MDSAANNSLAINKPLDDQIGEETTELENIIIQALANYNYDKSSLISILLDIQEEYNYLPPEAIVLVADKLDIRAIEVYSVATFYKVFSLKPRGKYIINVCVGTACHVRGGGKIVDEIQRELDIKDGETTKDMLFTLETVRCLGACALGPVMVVDGEYHGQMNAKKVSALLKKYANQGDNACST